MTDQKYPNEAIANIYERRSIRVYKDQPVPRETMQEVINAACMAPSLLNSQPWRFTVYEGDSREGILKLLRRTLRYLEDIIPVLDPEDRDEFLKEHGTEEEQKKTIEFFDTLGGAPAIVVVTMKKVRNDYNRRIGLLSCGMATQNLMLAAASLGLVTCCVGSTMWIEDSILQAMNRPDDEFVTLLSLGYPDEEEGMTKRKFNVVDWIGS